MKNPTLRCACNMNGDAQVRANQWPIVGGVEVFGMRCEYLLLPKRSPYSVAARRSSLQSIIGATPNCETEGHQSMKSCIHAGKSIQSSTMRSTWISHRYMARIFLS